MENSSENNLEFVRADLDLNRFQKYEAPIRQAKVLFVVTSFHKEDGNVFPIPFEAYSAFFDCLYQTPLKEEKDILFLPIFDFLDIPEDEIGSNDIRAVRENLEQKIETIGPELIIPLGNNPTLAVLKTGGITNKRGKEFYVETKKSRISVIPTFHPAVVYLEPVIRPIFIEDITNAYNKVILKLNKFKGKNYKLCQTMDEVREEFKKAKSSQIVAEDLETTGLDFGLDTITVFGASYGQGQAFVVPLNHHESPFTDTEIKEIYSLISDLQSDPNVTKILANAKFDLKMLMAVGITDFKNIEDVQLMHSLVDENRRHSLSEITKQFFPTELQDF